MKAKHIVKNQQQKTKKTRAQYLKVNDVTWGNIRILDKTDTSQILNATEKQNNILLAPLQGRQSSDKSKGERKLDLSWDYLVSKAHHLAPQCKLCEI